MSDGQRDGAQDGFHALQESPGRNGINYDRLIAVANADKTAHLETNATASLTLYPDAKAKNDRLASATNAATPFGTADSSQPTTITMASNHQAKSP